MVRSCTGICMVVVSKFLHAFCVFIQRSCNGLFWCPVESGPFDDVDDAAAFAIGSFSGDETVAGLGVAVRINFHCVRASSMAMWCPMSSPCASYSGQLPWSDHRRPC